ncbi:MAG: prepilin peptidase [Calditrichaeota bacterium]|nr:MAG: prepilin peptidase [Calditrichota bacterium]
MEIAVLLILSACIGSFLNVVIHRLPENKSLIFPASHCPECGQKIKPWQNIPVISYLLLLGRCAQCKVKIPVRYLIVEILTPLIILFLYMFFGLSLEFYKYAVLVLLLIPATFIDIDRQLLLDKITIPGMIIGLSISIFAEPAKFYIPFLSLLAGGGLLMLVALFGQFIYKQESMGGGDIKFGAMIGAFMTIDSIIFSLFTAFFIAAVFSIVGIFSGRLERRSIVPFGPFIALGALVSIGFKNQILQAYLAWIGWK